MEIEQVADSLVLSIPHAGRYSEGPYRCVSDAENVTAANNASEELDFKVHCKFLGWLIIVCVCVCEEALNISCCPGATAVREIPERI